MYWIRVFEKMTITRKCEVPSHIHKQWKLAPVDPVIGLLRRATQTDTQLLFLLQHKQPKTQQQLAVKARKIFSSECTSP